MAGFVEGGRSRAEHAVSRRLCGRGQIRRERSTYSWTGSISIGLGFVGVQSLDTGRPGYHPRVMLKAPFTF